jgi:hypothetical protein
MPYMDERIEPVSENFETMPFYNFTTEDFTPEQGAMWNSRSYLVKAGEIKFYPVFLANHLAKHLINRELIRTNEANMLDKGARTEIAKKILISQDEASKLLGIPIEKRVTKVVAPKKAKTELIDESEAKTSPLSKNKEVEDIPEVERTKEHKSVDIKSLK